MDAAAPVGGGSRSWDRRREAHLDRVRSCLTEALCLAHGRRKFYEFADIAAGQEARKARAADLAARAGGGEANRRAALFDIERGISDKAAEQRLAVRQELSAPLLTNLEDWMQAECKKLSRHSPVAKAMDYMLRRSGPFTRFVDNGRICLTNNDVDP